MDQPPDVHEIARAYYRLHKLRRGDRAQRLESNEYFWAWDEVHLGKTHDPMEVLDALFDEAGEDEEFLGALGAGPIEDVIGNGDLAAAIAERCQQDPRWATAVTRVYIDQAGWDRLPAPLQQLVAVSIHPQEQPVRQPKKTLKQPSRRQHRKGRHD